MEWGSGAAENEKFAEFPLPGVRPQGRTESAGKRLSVMLWSLKYGSQTPCEECQWIFRFPLRPATGSISKHYSVDYLSPCLYLTRCPDSVRTAGWRSDHFLQYLNLIHVQQVNEPKSEGNSIHFLIRFKQSQCRQNMCTYENDWPTWDGTKAWTTGT